MNKPLPDLPQLSLRTHKQTESTTAASLTVDGLNHLRRFISYALEEAQDVISPDDRELWALGLEGALCSLGERISTGGWLTGLRLKRRRLAVELEQERLKQAAKGSKVAESTHASPRRDATRSGDAQDTGSLIVSRGVGRRQWSEPNRPDAIATLRLLVEKSATLVPNAGAKHLLLTVGPTAPMGSGVIDHQCTFTPGVFSLPNDNSSGSPSGDVLYGLDTLEQLSADGLSSLQIVGGTFAFSGVTEPQHQLLVKVLRLCVYTYLAITLEQSLLSDSYVPLQFPKPAAVPHTRNGQHSPPITRAVTTGHVSGKVGSKRDSGLWAYFSRKKDDFLSRAAPSLIRRGSLELPLTRSRSRSRSPPRSSGEDIGTASHSDNHRPRRFSFISDYRPSFLHPSSPTSNNNHEEVKDKAVEQPISIALASLDKVRGLLSTSPGILISPPLVLVKLAAREKSDPNAKLGGDEKAALGSLLGWDSKQLRIGTPETGMVDTSGFVRQQSLSVLYSEFVAPRISRPATPDALSSSLVPPEPAQRPLVLCGRRKRWISLRFYSQHDDCLGETLLRLCARAHERCDNPDCAVTRGDHEVRLVHAGVRVTIQVKSGTSPLVYDDDEPPETWASCRICKEETKKVRMHDATYLLSFAKYLELLIYSPSLCSLTPTLCEHTQLPPRPWDSADCPLPRSRTNIQRNFSYSGHVVSLSLSLVQDVYDVRVPRLTILRSKPEKHGEPGTRPDDSAVLLSRITTEADRRVLRREIMQFWQVLSEHMDSLEVNFISEHTHSPHHKPLPRLPSADEAYAPLDEDGLATPKGEASHLPPLPPNTPKTPDGRSTRSFPFPHHHGSHERERSSAVNSSAASMSTDSLSLQEPTSLQLLTSMRHTFQRTEQGLYAELSTVPVAHLNDVRRSFVSAGRGATKRLSAWEAKHASGPPTVPGSIAQSEPEWWKTGCHAVPGGNIIVREDDWGSIIAFTLSSTDYHKELASMSLNRFPSAPTNPPSTPTAPRASFFTRNASARWFASSAPSPDPDQEGVVWHEPETYSAVISRRENPKDTASLLKLGLTEVLRQKTLPDPAGPSTPSKLAGIPIGAPPLAWAKPDVQVSKEAADGHLSLASKEGMDKVLQELEAVVEPPKSVRSSWSEHTHTSGSGFVETNIRRGKTASIISTDSGATTTGEHSMSNHCPTPEPPVPPPKDNHTTKPELSEHHTDASSGSRHPTETSVPSTEAEQPSVASHFANTLSSALRYMMRDSSPPPVPAKHHHGLLLTGSPAIDDRPHIKYDWTIGKRLKFSCTVYYAKQFDALRRRCGIEDVFLHSMARSENWVAEGGKSRSNFWKTSDNRFIIKTLVNAWNVADLHVLIELGPTYFKHIDATVNRPTVLAKLLGFYTVEIRNLETGSTQAKADLLVMENLFYDQKIVKTFDLKGIEGRKVKAASSGAGSKTLFDGEWIEDQQRALTLVQPYSKVVLQEAIKADSEFLARSNIMDYSLLVGIDVERKQVACGLVDTIGSYTFAKTLEYKAKQNLSSGKEVTVIPPHEYQERFVNAMDNYFVACPDKWSRPLDDTKIPGDYRLLPSVL